MKIEQITTTNNIVKEETILEDPMTTIFWNTNDNRNEIFLTGFAKNMDILKVTLPPSTVKTIAEMYNKVKFYIEEE